MIEAILAVFACWIYSIVPGGPYTRIGAAGLAYLGTRTLVRSILRVFEEDWTMRQLLAALTGAAFGAVLANLVVIPAHLLGAPATEAYVAFSTSFSIVCTWLFARLFMSYEPRILQAGIVKKASGNTNMIKILDSSAIIDARIRKLVDIEFVEGLIVIPDFVLDEIKRLMNKPEKKDRGQLGLDTATKLIDDYDYVVVYEYKIETEVDEAIIHMAQNLNAKIVTNDVAMIQLAKAKSIPAISLNDLAKASQPVHLPGEVIRSVKIVNNGKFPGQGLAYTRDGTIIIIPEGSQHMGSNVDVVITQAIQSNNGVTIFADLVS